MNIFKQPAPGYLKKRTRFNSCVLLFWAVLFFTVYLLYARTAMFYAKNAATDGVELDPAALAAASAETLGGLWVVDEPMGERGTWDYENWGVTIPESLLIDQVYRQGDYYRFLVPIEKVEMTNYGYYLSESYETLRIFEGDDAAFERQGEIVQRLGVATVGGVKYATLLPYGAEIHDGELVPCGVFTYLMSNYSVDLAAAGYTGETISPYLLDFRDIPVEAEGNDLIMLIIFSIIFPIFLLYALLCLVFPRLHMNYVLLSRSDDPDELSAILMSEMAQDGVYKQGRQVYTEHYIIKETLHSTKVFKNHLNRH